MVVNGYPYVEAGATASDVCAGDLTAGIAVSGAVTIQQVGSYTVGYSVADPSGNTSAASRTVTVRDTQPPAVEVSGPAVVEATGPAGAAVSFSASATDICDPALAPACSAASGSVFALGAHVVSCTATDASGNAATASYGVSIVDTTPPVVTPPANLTAVATSALGTAVAYPAATATDLVDTSVAATCSAASGSFFGLGATTVTCSATDDSGNTGAATFTVSVAFAWSGLLAPINGDGSSLFKLGSTVPVKFQLAGGSAGVADAVAAIYLAKVSNDVVGTEVEASSTSAATTGNLFRYDVESGQYIFNLSTKGLSKGTWQLRVDLGDGVLRTVFFSLK